MQQDRPVRLNEGALRAEAQTLEAESHSARQTNDSDDKKTRNSCQWRLYAWLRAEVVSEMQLQANISAD